MTGHDLARLEEWFGIYTRRHYCPDPEEQKNILLKIEHSSKVRKICARLAEGIGLAADRTLLAEAVGLLHDIGRFPQYSRYKTFRDALSVNHGRLGAEVLAEEGILSFLTEEEQAIITTAVHFHNAFAVPDLPEADRILFLKIARDSDKLDIWRIFTGLFELPEEERPSEIGLGYPDTPGYSGEIISTILRSQPVSLKHISCINDFKLLQLSWIADLNFPVSYRLLLEGDYINRLISLLPRCDEMAKVSGFLHEYAAEKADEGR